MKKVLIPTVFLLLFVLIKANAQNNYSKTYYDTYNNITKYYEKPAVTTNYNTPSYNNNNYSTPSYNNYNNSYSDTYNSNNATNTSLERREADFIGSTVSFCEKIENGKPVGVYNNFTLSPYGGVVKIYVDLPVSVNSKGIKARILKYETYSNSNEVTSNKKNRKEKNEISGDYFNVDIVSVTTEPSYNKIWFEYDFAKFGAGYYKFGIYTNEGVYINSGYVEIKPISN